MLNNASAESAPLPCDVVVIGGGPAGSTIAALLAERGRSVVLLEKSRHPRFHIGESLLPANMPLFERLGVAEEMQRIGMPKHGAQFVSPWHGDPVTYDFSDAMDKTYPSAYQVRRAEFDEILFRNAARKGATAIEECRATSVEFNAGGALIGARPSTGPERRWQARFVIDASGRDTLLANQSRTKRRNRKHNSAAIYGHFRDAARQPGKAEGNISLFWFEHGWFWFIPLIDGTTSVGAVCWPYYMASRKTDPERFFLDTIAMSPALAARLSGATLVSPVTATGNYSYEVERAAGRNYLLLGDAFTFIDPVFSTGVLLAMQSAFDGADTVETCLDHPRRARGALKAFDARMRRGPKIFSWFIYRLTTPTFRDMFMRPRNAKLQEAVLSVLAGDLFQGTPVHGRLFAFKVIYYLKSLFTLRTSLAAWQRRRRAIRQLGVEAPAG